MSSTTPREPQNVAGPGETGGEVRPARRAPRSYRAPGWSGRWRVGRWQDWANLLLGAWIFITPWVFGSAYATSAGTTYTGAGGNSWNAWITGGIIFIVALFALAMPSAKWLELVNALAAIWLFVSPWVLGFGTGRNTNYGGAWSDWVVGVVVFILAIWAWTLPVAGPPGTTGYSRRPRRRL